MAVDMSPSSGDSWPALPYEAFQPTRYLVHMVLQCVGKLKLAEPFQAQWAQVPLWLNATGLTTGPLRYDGGVYEVRADLLTHEVQWLTSTGVTGRLPLGPTPVATFVGSLLDQLRGAGIAASINLMPQEIADPIPFDQDHQERPYDRALVDAWWRSMLRTQQVLQAFHGRFTGKIQDVGLMWGTLDLRTAIYNGKPAAPSPGDGFIRRNAMNAELMEMGWWSGDPSYPKAAFFSFTYPEPKGIAGVTIAPRAARWDPKMGEFLLDHDDLRQSSTPERDLLSFFETTYEAGATAAGWRPELLNSGRPE